MADNKNSEVWLELSQGHLKLLVEGVPFNVVVNSNGQSLPGPSTTVEKADREANANGESAGVDQNYYRQISEEMYQEIGRLAKNLNISFQDLAINEILEGDSTSEESWGQSRHQLPNLMLMNEEASMNILELVENIQEECQGVQSALEKVSQPALLNSATPPNMTAGMDKLLAFFQNAGSLLSTLIAEAEELQNRLQALESQPPSPPSGQTSRSHAPSVSCQIPLESILQTLYKFCTSDTVKQQLNGLLDNRDTLFQGQQLAEALNELTQTMTPVDGCLNVPVEQLFQILAAACQDEHTTAWLRKMETSSNSRSLWYHLDTIIPLKVTTPGTEEDTQNLGAAAEDGLNNGLPVAAVNSQISTYVERLRQLAYQLEELQPGKIARQTSHSPPDRDQAMLPVVSAARESMRHINRSLSRIIEGLSYQDLSSQPLIKVLKTLRQVQVHLLTLLVAYGIKIKKKEEKKELTVAESEALARSEVDRLITYISPATPEGEPQPEKLPESHSLDQEAINDLLANLGF
ncbi:MAG: hypothetical protein ACLFUU_08815 [Desulfobacteraceae bacterium]